MVFLLPFELIEKVVKYLNINDIRNLLKITECENEKILFRKLVANDLELNVNFYNDLYLDTLYENIDNEIYILQCKFFLDMNMGPIEVINENTERINLFRDFITNKNVNQNDIYKKLNEFKYIVDYLLNKYKDHCNILDCRSPFKFIPTKKELVNNLL